MKNLTKTVQVCTSIDKLDGIGSVGNEKRFYERDESAVIENCQIYLVFKAEHK